MRVSLNVYVHACIFEIICVHVCVHVHAYVHSVPDVAESGSKSSSMLLVSVLQFQLMGSELLSPASVHLCVSVGVHMCSLPPPE